MTAYIIPRVVSQYHAQYPACENKSHQMTSLRQYLAACG